MRASYSQIGTFEQCPYKWSLRYLEGMKAIEDRDANDALVLGSALHKGMEMRDPQAAVDYYREEMNVASDLTVHEEMKLRAMVAKGLEIIPDGLHETPLDVEGEFKGFIDLLVPVEGRENVFDMYDYKYANAKSADKYAESPQLSIYKYYFEQLVAAKIRNMAFVLFPKVAIRQKKTETLDQFRRRLRDTLDQTEVQTIPVEYSQQAVDDFLAEKKAIELYSETMEEFPKAESRLCDWCDYQSFCQKGEMTMMLPKAERKLRTEQGKAKLWIYGEPFTGKTTFANAAPMPLFLNTDGNVKFIDSPPIPIKDTLETEGRMTKKKFGWATFKDAVAELEKDPQGFETVVVDLVEGVYEMCRTYMYDKRGWEHESDDSFKAWDIVRKEFLDTMRRLTNLDMNVILISHEDSSRDFTRPAGNKVTALKPNISEKVAKQLAGMVDLVGHTVVRDDVYSLEFKTDESIFGGGRLKLGKKRIPLCWEDFAAEYEEARSKYMQTRAVELDTQAEAKEDTEPAKETKKRTKAVKKDEKPAEQVPFDEETVEEAQPEPQEAPDTEQLKKRTRKKRTAE